VVDIADPLHLTWGSHTVFVDLAATEIVSAEKGGRNIAVEVKGFGGRSDVHDLEHALGQFLLYRSVIARTEPDRSLYLAIPEVTFRLLFESPLGQIVREDYRLNLVVFDPNTEVFVQWINSINSERPSAPS
jgi:hypothetical protein